MTGDPRKAFFPDRHMSARLRRAEPPAVVFDPTIALIGIFETRLRCDEVASIETPFRAMELPKSVYSANRADFCRAGATALGGKINWYSHSLSAVGGNGNLSRFPDCRHVNR